MTKYNPSVSCDINNVTGINAIVKTCSVKIKRITSSFKDLCINKPTLPTHVFDDVSTPISCINTTDIDDIERSSSQSLKNIAKCSTISCENTHPSGLLGEENLNNTYVSRDAQASCRMVPPFILNKHIHRFGISNPKSCFKRNISHVERCRQCDMITQVLSYKLPRCERIPTFTERNPLCFESMRGFELFSSLARESASPIAPASGYTSTTLK